MHILINTILLIALFSAALVFIYRRQKSHSIHCPYCTIEQTFVHSLAREIKNGGSTYLICCISCEKDFQLKPTLSAIGADPYYLASKLEK